MLVHRWWSYPQPPPSDPLLSVGPGRLAWRVAPGIGWGLGTVRARAIVAGFALVMGPSSGIGGAVCPDRRVVDVRSSPRRDIGRRLGAVRALCTGFGGPGCPEPRVVDARDVLTGAFTTPRPFETPTAS
ncbi:hypothetical protein JCM33774_03770 [Actinophytocola sp. KF-1]